jgi:hypothetical protein
MNRLITAWLLAAAVLLICTTVYAMELKVGDILFGSNISSDEGYKEGVFRVDSLTSAGPVASFFTETCGNGYLKDITFGLNGEVFLLLDCNSLLPDVGRLDPASGTLISPPILDDDLLFDTVDLLPDRDGSLLILCKSGCSVQNGPNPTLKP